MKSMKWILATGLIVPLIILSGVFTQPAEAQSSGQAQSSEEAATQPEMTATQEANIRAYIKLLRSDVRSQATSILGQMMELNSAQAAKFWPIYHEFSLKLQAINDQKLDGILEYAKIYNTDSMTDAKAAGLANLALELEGKRLALKKEYYEKVREQLGGVIAARFLQIENQMLMITDLQISSSLPIVGQ